MTHGGEVVADAVSIVARRRQMELRQGAVDGGVKRGGRKAWRVGCQAEE